MTTIIPQGGNGGFGGGGVSLPRLINLITVPGVQQVLLQVQIAELNRTALREIGVDWLLKTPSATLGTQISGSVLQSADAAAGSAPSLLTANLFPGSGTTSVTVQYKTFGVQLNFVPYILDDETIRLKVAPEASTLDYAICTMFSNTSHRRQERELIVLVTPHLIPRNIASLDLAVT